ncbi:MAG: T9SS type A sorting domain-containing protein [Bacteroidota bacterium]
MKKIYSFVLGMVIVAGAMAQSTPNITVPYPSPKSPASIPPKPAYNNLATNQFIIDYDTADNAAQVNLYGWQYDRFIWDFNYNYQPTDSSLKYFIVAYDSLYDVYNGIGYARSTVSTIRCDSIYMALGQENNSGTDDTIIVKLISVNTNGYPGATVMWSDTTIIPASSPWNSGTDWLNPVLVSMPCGYTVTNNDRFALRVEYHGNKMDTCGWLAGFGNQAPLGTCATYAANRTEYAPYKLSGTGYYNANTFSFWTQYASYGTLPTASGANIYYNCDGVTGYTFGADGENYLQNISVWVMVTTDPLSVAENAELGIKLHPNQPNPFKGTTTVQYELENSGKVSLEIYDLTGKLITTINEGNQPAGKHSIEVDGSSLQAGVYFYTLVVDGVKLTGKMTVVN